MLEFLRRLGLHLVFNRVVLPGLLVKSGVSAVSAVCFYTQGHFLWIYTDSAASGYLIAAGLILILRRYLPKPTEDKMFSLNVKQLKIVTAWIMVIVGGATCAGSIIMIAFWGCWILLLSAVALAIFIAGCLVAFKPEA